MWNGGLLIVFTLCYKASMSRRVRVSDGKVNQVRHYTSLVWLTQTEYPWKREYLNNKWICVAFTVCYCFFHLHCFNGNHISMLRTCVSLPQPTMRNVSYITCSNLHFILYCNNCELQLLPVFHLNRTPCQLGMF